MSEFGPAWAITLAVEGGHNPEDHGSDTWYGIRRADNPDMPWPPTPEQAKARAEERYWNPYHFALLPQAIACAAFDWIFNGGPACAALQRVLGVAVDGVIGPGTADAAKRADQTTLLIDYLAARAMYYSRLLTFQIDGLTWMRRLFEIERQCLRLVGQ